MSRYIITGKIFTDVSCSKNREINTHTFELNGIEVNYNDLRKVAQILLPEVDQLTISKNGQVISIDARYGGLEKIPLDLLNQR